MDANLDKKIDKIIEAMVTGKIDSETAIRRLTNLDGMDQGRPEYIVRSLETVDVLQSAPTK